ncbi:site-specific DNA-methyltransferase [Ruminiclostridium josui]|uniref:site-specific DNA-methyltransferase n=1 Tax=Ruminiclostridium josui TaxID=1499 RepID=UPI000463627A|nr:site-specific DNA-methyltransferase [Ruminiclostridium josui]
MIKDIMNANDSATPNCREMAVLKENFPSCFKADGSFDIERFKEFLSDKIAVTGEGYELKFLGKNYARLLASIDTTTVVVPDEEHNSKSENMNSENIYISGDNLDGLKHLLKSYSRQVKCIYIDPPYNTGTDGFVYNDQFNFTVEELSEKLSIREEQAQRILDLTKRGSASHSAWLMFMYPRLLLARDLLKDDGIIFISIDDNEQANLKLICDDVFGENNFLTCISRATGTPTGGGFDGLVNELDYMLVYARNITAAVINGLAMNEDDARIYNQIDEDGNRYLTRSLRRTGGEDRREDRPTMYYPLIAPDGTEVYPIGPTGYESRWICAPETAKKLEEDGLIEWRKTDLLGKKVWHPYQKYYLENRTKAPGNIWQDFFWPPDDTNHEFLWTDIEGNKKATRDIRDLFDGQKVFETAKPIGLLEKVLTIGSNDGDIIVDFFSGSATTAHAIMRMNAVTQGKRKYILIQLQEPVKPGSDAEKAGYTTIDQIGMDRILRAAVKIREKYPDTTVDLGFKHYTLVEPEQNTLDKLEKFDPTENKLFADKDILSDFGKPTVLATWLVRDGYGLTAEAEELNFAGYNGYYIGKHLYLIDPELSNKAIEAIVVKYETDGSFNPENVVLFGYSFTWTEMEALKINLKRLKDTEKNLRINFDIRY